MRRSLMALRTKIFRQDSAKKSRRNIRPGLMVCSLVMSLALSLQANLTTSKGNILFDVNDDGTQEMRLDGTGLALGTETDPSANLHVTGNGLFSNSLTIGSSTLSSSNLYLGGTVGFGIEQVSSDTIVGANSFILANSGSGNVTLTLPAAASYTGILYHIKKTNSSNEVIISGGGSNIDAEASIKLSSGNQGYLKVMSDGTQWRIDSISGNISN